MIFKIFISFFSFIIIISIFSGLTPIDDFTHLAKPALAIQHEILWISNSTCIDVDWDDTNGIVRNQAQIDASSINLTWTGNPIHMCVWYHDWPDTSEDCDHFASWNEGIPGTYSLNRPVPPSQTFTIPNSPIPANKVNLRGIDGILDYTVTFSNPGTYNSYVRWSEGDKNQSSNHCSSQGEMARQYLNNFTVTQNPPPPGSFTLTGSPACSNTTPYNVLSWTTSSGATSYTVSRFVNGVNVGGGRSFVPSDGNLWYDWGAVRGTTYVYIMVATNNSGGSTQANPVSVTTVYCSTPTASLKINNVAYPVTPATVFVGVPYTVNTGCIGPDQSEYRGNIETYVSGVGVYTGVPGIKLSGGLWNGTNNTNNWSQNAQPGNANNHYFYQDACANLYSGLTDWENAYFDPKFSGNLTASVVDYNTISVTWSGITSPTTGDWISIYIPGTADNSYAFNDSSGQPFWVYTHTTECLKGVRPSSPLASGTCTITVPTRLATDTAYEARLFSNDSFYKLAVSNTFRFLPTANLSANAPSKNVVSVTWNNNGSFSTGDWISIYTPGAPDTNYAYPNFWVYLNVSNCFKGVKYTSGIRDGSCNITLPGNLTPRTNYEARIFSDDTFYKMDTATFQYVPNTVPPTITNTTAMPACFTDGTVNVSTWLAAQPMRADVSDGDGISDVQFRLVDKAAPTVAIQSARGDGPYTSSGTYTHSFDGTGLQAGHTYLVQVKASDTIPNTTPWISFIGPGFDYVSTCQGAYFETRGGDVHSNTNISQPSPGP